MKNGFVLAPVVFAHRLDRAAAAAAAALAFAAFCAASSAVYLVNDLKDRDQDRRHPVKRRRPIASGELPAGIAGLAAILLLAAAAALAVRLGAGYSLCLAGYVALNLLYSLALKHVVILDVMTIALGFVLRVLAGARAVEVQVSSWLILCTIFVALFLGFSKRRHELAQAPESNAGTRRVLEHYSLPFLDQMINVVTASTVVAYALYTASPETQAKLGSDRLIYSVPLVLFGIFRFLFLLYRRDDERSPTDAILHDPPFLLNLALWGAVVLALIYGG